MYTVAAKQVSKYFLKEGSGDEAGWAAEPDPQGSSVQSAQTSPQKLWSH